MSVNTKTVEGRRELKFETLDDLRAEIERLATGEVRTLGNWSLAQLFTHLAAGFNSVLDGSSFKAPWFFKLMAPFMKKKFLYGGIPSGFNMPKEAEAQFLPSNDADTQAAKDELLAAISRVDSAADCDLAPHPMFGKLSKGEAIQFHLRHAEMHLSFAIPDAS